MALKFAKLTRPAIRKTMPGERIMEHGISFERLSTGDGVYRVNVMVDGLRVHRTVGKESAGVTREQCEQFIEQARTQAREGRLNLPKGRKIPLSFVQAAARYVLRLKDEAGLNLLKKEQHLRDHLTPFFGSTPLNKITTDKVERYKRARGDAGAASGTVNRELATLSHLLTKAVEWQWLSHKPARMPRTKEQPGRITYLTTEQASRLIEAARTDQSPDIYPFIVIGLATSMRRMEILAMRLEHIDPGRRRIFIPEAKGGAREQPMTAHLARFLQDYLDAAEPGKAWLFPSKRSASGHVMNIEKQFRRVVSAAGLDPKAIVRHTLRHTAITHLVQAGVDLPTVQRVSGHKTLQMVVRYAHQNGEHIQAAMDKLEVRYGQGELVNANDVSSLKGTAKR